jgi:hypothetical protein
MIPYDPRWENFGFLRQDSSIRLRLGAPDKRGTHAVLESARMMCRRYPKTSKSFWAGVRTTARAASSCMAEIGSSYASQRLALVNILELSESP